MWTVAVLDLQSGRQPAYRMRRYKLETLAGVGRGISPLVFGDNGQAKRLADKRERWQDCLPARGRPRHEIEGRLHRQLTELVRRKRIDRGFQLHIRFDVGLQPETRRALPAIAQAHRQRIAGAQIAAPNPNQQGVRKGADVEPVEPHFKLGAVAGFHRGEICRLRLVELRLAHVGGGPPRDLDHAGIVDAESACGVHQGQFDMRACDERACRRKLDPSHLFGKIGRKWHWLCSLLGLDVQILHQPPELGVIVANEGGELFGRSADRLLRRVRENSCAPPDRQSPC